MSATQPRAAAPIGLIAIGFAGSTIVTPLYALYQARFGFSTIVLTVVYAAYVLGNLAGLLFLGRLSDRVGRRPVALAAIALAALSSGLFLLAQGTGWLGVGRAVSGLAVGLASGTGTAWLVDLQPGDRGRATLAATLANMAGIGLAPLFAGLLAQFAPAPLVLPYLVYWGCAAVVLVAVLRAPETVPRQPIDRGLFRPQLALPADARAAFVAPVATAFTVFAFGGYYIALLPTILRQAMHLTGPALGGAIVAELFAASALAIVATRNLASRRAMLAGLAAVIPGLALIVLAQSRHSLALLLIATAFGGAALATGYRGSLAIVNEIAAPDARAGLVSAYFVVCFVGNSVPVIGVAVLARLFDPVTAGEVFAAVMLAIALLALVADRRYAPASR